jgi:murein DD-endopeptidase MepM/ murein hydrolase activator NlpD
VANHRAERRAPSRRVTRTRAAQTQTSAVAAGRRKATRSARTPRAAAAITPERRRAAHAGGRKNLLPGLPSAPSLVGTAALALAAVGAMVSQTTTLPDQDFHKFATQASVLNAASSMGAGDALSGRERAVSRDSKREALEDAATAELLAAAESQAKERDAVLAELAESAEKHAHKIATAWQPPIASGSYSLSAGFGECSYLWVNCHTGLDLSASYGTEIYSVAKGVVTEVGYDGSYGNKTVVTLEDGTEIWYCHQSSFVASEGEAVMPGQLLGYVGSTGNSTGAHLHLEVHPGAGDAVDPYQALQAHGLRL